MNHVNGSTEHDPDPMMSLQRRRRRSSGTSVEHRDGKSAHGTDTEGPVDDTSQEMVRQIFYFQGGIWVFFHL